MKISTFFQHEIWLPDPFFIKHGDFKEPLSPDHIALKIFSNGTVDYTRRRHLILSCIGNLNIFPFDDPACTFSIESSEYFFPFDDPRLHLLHREQ
ncbi:hypothetical protein HAZT_HAZT009611 [Hyalella azteca]|uniref:Neurotransmitter-gated ion-channel ligand-binding domain-containing protein n=1 Tax=Hyalella azteca TaxID=294128 RepID=A0A6A0H595_HYAAZ|nr:hypothetical protein HAZT_HAZT009611 [Hyalella azteca]